ncbi:MAG: hypothetical protein R3E64_03135 [Halioglobus sp.]
MERTKTALSYLASTMALLMLSACTQTVGHFTPAIAANPENTVFYLYRPAASNPGLMKPLKFAYPDVLIDGKSIGVLKYDEYLMTELTPGAHTITITGLTAAASGWADRDIEQEIPASDSKQVYMKLQVEYNLDDMNLGQLGPKYIINLIPVASENAKYEIRNTSPASN